MTPLSPLPSSVSLYPPISDIDVFLVCELSSLGLFVRVGFVRGDEAGEAVTGGGRGCWCMLLNVLRLWGIGVAFDMAS